MTSRQNRIKRHHRIREKIAGTKEMPRVCVFKSNKHIYVQFIDDVVGKTLVSANDITLKTKGTKSDLATEVAKIAAERAKQAGFKKVFFDRGGYKYHGRIKALAEALRSANLEF